MYNENFVTAIIAAAGMGRRMKKSLNKQFLSINDLPILAHTLKKFDNCAYVDFILILIKESDIPYLSFILNKNKLKKDFKIVYGAKERSDSILNGLKNIPKETSIVLTHDGVRPFVSEEKIREAIENVFFTGASVLGVPVKDTVKVSKNGSYVDYTPKRDELFAIQTPQVFKTDLLLKAYKIAEEEGYTATDDCALVEKIGVKVKIIPSDYKNIKITTQEDLIIAEAIAKSESQERK